MTSRFSRSRIRGADGQRGTALIEFAFILPFLFVVTLTVVDLSRAFYLKSMITAAAREGARVAVVQATPTAGAGYDSVLTRASRVLQYSGMAVGPSNVHVGESAELDSVRVSSQFNWLYLGLLNYFGASSFTNPQTLTATAVMRREG